MFTTVNGTIHILKWEENVTLKNVDEFRQKMQLFINSEFNHLILNLSEMNYINSAGLGIIADSVMNSRKNQKDLVIAEIQDSIKEIFSIVKFTSFMKLYRTEEEAVKAFTGDHYDS